MTTMSKAKYVRCARADIPEAIRFHVPAYYQGQTVEYAWGTFGRAEACDGDPYMRVTDRSDGSVAYYRLAAVQRDEVTP